MHSIELFTGAGGLALGSHLAGFDHVAVVEHNHDACDTLRLNQTIQAVPGMDWPVYEVNVQAFNYEPYQRRQVDLLAGGAPCQPFSLGGKHAGHADERNMFPEVIRAVRNLGPRAILLENVRGLTRAGFFPYFQYILDQLASPCIELKPDEHWQDHHRRIQQHLAARDNGAAELRYTVKWMLYNTADFGIPQERHRVFIVAFRSDLPIHWRFPAPTHTQDALVYAQYVNGSYWDEHHVAQKPAPERLAARIARLAAQAQPFAHRWRTVRDAISDLPEPVDYDPQPAVANHVGIPDARVYPGHTGSPWDWPAKTIKAGDHGNPGGENMLRRDDGSVRYFTVRELARLQTFPDAWQFANSWTESRRQLGNAVPVAMIKILARLIQEELAGLDHQPPLEYQQVTHLVALNVGG